MKDPVCLLELGFITNHTNPQKHRLASWAPEGGKQVGSSNLDLFRKQEDTSGSQIKSELHRKKDRQRNLVPAKTGILILIMAFSNTMMYFAAYGLTSSLTSHTLDVYTRRSLWIVQPKLKSPKKLHLSSERGCSGGSNFSTEFD